MFRFVILLLVCWGLSPIASAQSTVFKTKDENGNTVYTDQASEQAEEIKVDTPQTFTAPKPVTSLSPKPKEVETGPAYKSLMITSPEHDTAIRNNAGNITVTLSVEPALQPNHSIEVLVDGVVASTKASSAPVSLTNLDRGTHQFQARIVENESGEILQTSNSVSTTLLRVSIIPRRN